MDGRASLQVATISSFRRHLCRSFRRRCILIEMKYETIRGDQFTIQCNARLIDSFRGLRRIRTLPMHRLVSMTDSAAHFDSSKRSQMSFFLFCLLNRLSITSLEMRRRRWAQNAMSLIAFVADENESPFKLDFFN